MKKSIFCLTIFISFFFIHTGNSQTDMSNYSENQKKFYQSCSSKVMTNVIFDCECLVEMYYEAIENMKQDKISKLLEDYQTNGKKVLEFACEKNRKVSIVRGKVKFYPENPPSKEWAEKNYGIAQDPCLLLKELEAGNLPEFELSDEEPDISHVMMELYKDISCRDEQSIYDYFYKQAQEHYNSKLSEIKINKSEADFCDCYAKEITLRLMNGEEYSSRFSSNAHGKAMSKCK